MAAEILRPRPDHDHAEPRTRHEWPRWDSLNRPGISGVNRAGIIGDLVK
jgi:hypothetical protein